MKQFVVSLFLMFFFVATVSAQRWFGDDGGADMKRSQWGIDLGVGKMADVDGSVGFSGGIRYQYNVHRFLGVDVFGVNYVGQTVRGEGLGPSVLQAMMGLRGKTPTLYQDVSAYLGLRLGYGHDFYVEEGGLALELNLGINITPHLSLGYVFNMQKLKFENASAKYKFNGLRLGFVF
ncbi:hypothetical protein [uncultured Bacteroides sp.]|uniref:hypothetical protein n=1 Tax=uncultured Bacteroides sp. TaxID=162156 RepID=UPI0025EA84DC|nr:hypothetical protein [uncultured Bacteroides sp.]